jgi:hypothetical protein
VALGDGRCDTLIAEAANVGTEEVEVTVRPFEEETMPASGSCR